VAVVTEDGPVLLNKNVVNESEPLLQLIGDLPSSTPVAFEAASRCGMREEPRSVRMKDARTERTVVLASGLGYGLGPAWRGSIRLPLAWPGTAAL